jgi:hypothetical protein
MRNWTKEVGMRIGAVFLALFSGSAAAETVDPDAQMSVVGEAMQAVLIVQQAVASYRASHGGFPASNEQAGLPAPGQFATNSVKRVVIGSDGVIDVMLTAASGVDGGVIRFHPRYAAESGGGNVHWTCASGSYSNIGDLTGGVCEYTNQP